MDMERPLCGSWSELISYLVTPYDGEFDVVFRDALLLTLNDISTPLRLTKSLCKHLLNESPYGNYEQQLGCANVEIMDEIALQSVVDRLEWIVQIFRVWLDRYPFDFDDNVVEVVRVETRDFLPLWESDALAESAAVFVGLMKLKVMLESIGEKKLVPAPKDKRVSLSKQIIRKITRSDHKKVVCVCELEASPKVVACQLTRLQWAVFSEIRPRELLAMEYITGNSKCGGWDKAASVSRCVAFHNRVAAWTLAQVNMSESREDSSVIHFLLDVVDVCVNLGNFESSFAMVGALSMIEKRKDCAQAWKLALEVEEYGAKWQNLKVLLEPENHFLEYHEKYGKLNGSGSTRIPFLGIVIGEICRLCPRWRMDKESVQPRTRDRIDFSRCLSLYRLVNAVELATRESTAELQSAEDAETAQEKHVCKTIRRSLEAVDVQDNGKIYCAFDDATLLWTSRVRRATPSQVLRYMLTNYGRDVRFCNALFLCFEDFLTKDELLSYLLLELRKPMRSLQTETIGSARKEYQQYEWGKAKITTILCLQMWMKEYRGDFSVDMIERIEQQMSELPDPCWKELLGWWVFEWVDECFQDCRDFVRDYKGSPDMVESQSNVTEEKYQRDFELNASIFELKPRLVAEQLTILRANQFAAIPMRELTQCRWESAEKQTLAPKSAVFIDFQNKIKFWVIQEVVVRYNHLEMRSRVMEFFVDVGYELLNIGNLDCAFAVFGGLSSSAVDRLKDTWVHVGSSYHARRDEGKEVAKVDGNFRNYRSALSKRVGKEEPYLVYLGVHTADLFKIRERAKRANGSSSTEDWTLTMLNDLDVEVVPIVGKEGTMVNFSQYVTSYAVIEQVKASQAQATRFGFGTNSDVQALLNTVLMSADELNDDEFYSFSLEAQPRDKDKKAEIMLEENLSFF